MAKNHLTRCTPESQGIASQAVAGFVEAVNQTIHEMHSFMLLRHGSVVAEGWWQPYGPDRPHMLFSLSKSFTSTAIGLAVAEGRLTVDDRVVDFFPEKTPEDVDPNLAKMRVRHLLSMSTGHATDSTGRIQAGDWVEGFLGLPVEHEPGTVFVYNSGATYMLSAIIQKVTGMKLIDYLTPRLFEPLGITGATWASSPQGINVGGWGLSIKTEDIARFGQLYLQQGRWNGAQIVPEAWVAEATSFQISNKGEGANLDWQQGYGYQFWRCRHNAYRGDGAFGQYCVVMPEQDAVLAITSGLGDMQPVLDLVWEKLLPAMQPEPLPENPAAQYDLTQCLGGLHLAPPAGSVDAPAAAQITGRVYRMAENPLKVEQVEFDLRPETWTMKVTDAAGRHSVSGGWGTWLEGQTAVFSLNGESNVVCSSGVWTAEDTLLLTLRFVESPFYFTLTCTFDGNKVNLQPEQNVKFDPQGMPALVGQLE